VAKKKSDWGTRIGIPVIVGIALLVIGTQVTDFIETPNLVGSVKSGTSLCPQGLNFFSGISNFGLTFVNYGDEDGSFTTKISSNDVLSKYQNSGYDFSQTSTHDWYAKVGKDIDFNFELQRIDAENPPKTISIDVNAVCGTDLAGVLNLKCGDRQFTCDYIQDEQEHRSTYYSLIP
jgi:hypothetical protein